MDNRFLLSISTEVSTFFRSNGNVGVWSSENRLYIEGNLKNENILPSSHGVEANSFFNLPSHQSIYLVKNDKKQTFMPAVCLVKVRWCCGTLEVVLAWYFSETFFCAVQKIALRKRWSFPFHAMRTVVRKAEVCPILALYTV